MCTPLPSTPHPPTHLLPGRGAYGTVYKALDKVRQQHVAIKIMSLSEAAPEDLGRIQQEIDLLAGD